MASVVLLLTPDPAVLYIGIHLGAIVHIAAAASGLPMHSLLPCTIRILFRGRGETNRIDIADALMRPALEAAGMAAK